jgi:hypothetical protein
MFKNVYLPYRFITLFFSVLITTGFSAYAQSPSSQTSTYAQDVQSAMEKSSENSKAQFEKNYPPPSLPKINPPALSSNEGTADPHKKEEDSKETGKPDYTVSGKNPYDGTKNPYYSAPSSPASNPPASSSSSSTGSTTEEKKGFDNHTTPPFNIFVAPGQNNKQPSTVPYSYK